MRATSLASIEVFEALGHPWSLAMESSPPPLPAYDPVARFYSLFPPGHDGVRLGEWVPSNVSNSTG